MPARDNECLTKNRGKKRPRMAGNPMVICFVRHANHTDSAANGEFATGLKEDLLEMIAWAWGK